MGVYHRIKSDFDLQAVGAKDAIAATFFDFHKVGSGKNTSALLSSPAACLARVPPSFFLHYLSIYLFTYLLYCLSIYLYIAQYVLKFCYPY